MGKRKDRVRHMTPPWSLAAYHGLPGESPSWAPPSSSLILLGLIFHPRDPLTRLKSSSGSSDSEHAADSPPTPSPEPKPFSESTASEYAAELRQFHLKHLWKPSVAPNSKKYRPFGAFDWTLPVEPLWNERLGERVCILDLDSRAFDAPGQIFGSEPMSWDDAHAVHGLSMGIFNHWLYAKIHGYKYYFVEIEEPPDRRSSWKKPSVMAKILREHDVCVYLDSDAIFYRPDLPLEWLMNYWQLFPQTNSLGLAADPDKPFNKDKFGNLYLNTGFIIAQNNPMTYQILDAWHRCADDGEPFPECVDFRYNDPGRPTDQGGFGTYVRYNFTDSIRELPCTEANGFPESNSGCDGKLIHHLWYNKFDQIKIDVGLHVPGPFLKMFHEQFRAEMDSFYFKEKDLMSKGPKAASKRPPASALPKEN